MKIEYTVDIKKKTHSPSLYFISREQNQLASIQNKMKCFKLTTIICPGDSNLLLFLWFMCKSVFEWVKLEVLISVPEDAEGKVLLEPNPLSPYILIRHGNTGKCQRRAKVLLKWTY